MKSKIKIILALSAAAVLVAVALCLTIFFLREQEAPSGQVSPESHTVMAIDAAEIASVTVRNAMGETYQIQLGGSHSGMLAGVDETVDLDTMSLSLFLSKFLSIKSYHDPVPLESGDALAAYGLDNPAGAVTIEKMDGTATTVRIGDQTVKKNGYYLYVEGEPNVHVVENSYYDYLNYSRNDFISKQLASVDQETAFTITQLSIRNRDRDYDAITIQMRFGQYEDNSIYMYEVVEPEYHAADDYKILENVFTYLNPLKGVGVYSLDTSEENLAALDLLEPQYSLSYINEGIQREFSFSQLESGAVLGMKKDGNVILEMDPAILHMLNIQVADVSNAYILLQEISEVNRYTVNVGGKSYAFALTAEDGELRQVSFEGQTLDVEAFRELYSLGLDIKIVGDMENPEEKGSHILNITYQCTDGTEHSVDYYAFDGRYCYVTLDGSGRFIVRLSAIEAFTEYLYTLIGEENPEL